LDINVASVSKDSLRILKQFLPYRLRRLVINKLLSFELIEFLAVFSFANAIIRQHEQFHVQANVLSVFTVHVVLDNAVAVGRNPVDVPD
jgi:hypothetical protein